MITREDVRQFWRDVGDAKLGESVGCYVFARRTTRGITPVYVGMTARGFKQEAFTQMGCYNEELAKHKRGVPVMFFVVPDWKAKSGAKSTKTIVGEVEDFLIGVAASANADLANVQGNRRRWSIRGVHQGKGGQGGGPAKQFRRMLKLHGLF